METWKIWKETSKNESRLQFSWTDLAEIMQEPQFNLKGKVNPSILKDDFSSRTDPSILTSIAPVSLHRSNETS